MRRWLSTRGKEQATSAILPYVATKNEIVFNPTMLYALKFLNVPRMLITRFGYPKLRISLFASPFILSSVIRKTIDRGYVLHAY